MTFWSRFRSWCSVTLRRARMESEMDTEFRFHIEAYAEDLMRGGVSREEAMRRARIEFGGIERVKEEGRDARGAFILESFLHDIRFGLRTLRKSPGFMAATVLTLALGVGGNAVVFSLAYNALLRPLPYASPERIVALSETNLQRGISGSRAAAANFYDWKDQGDAFSSMAAFAEWRFNITGTGEPQNVPGALVTADFFTTLGTPALHGRTFRLDEDQPGKEMVVVLSERLWNRLFGASTPFSNQRIIVNQSVMTVVGVMPQTFAFPLRTTEMWVPLSLSTENKANRDGKWLRVIARLKTGTSVTKAQENLHIIARRLEVAYPSSNLGWGATVISLRDSMVRDARPTLWLLLGSVALLLLLACANVSSLISARATGRTGELAVRFSIGATRSRVCRQLITESLLLVALGDALALLVAFWCLHGINTLRLPGFPWAQDVELNFPVLVFTMAISLVVVALIGLVPAIRASSRDAFEVLRRSGETARAVPGARLSRLVVAQISLAFVLMILAGLLTNSFLRLSHVYPGFRVQNVLSANLTLPRSKYQSNRQQVDFFASVIEKIQRTPGVIDAGGVSDLPLLGNRMSFKILFKDGESSGHAGPSGAGVRWVTPNYFHTLGIPLDTGRYFSEGDSVSATPAAIISQSMARSWWPSSNPLGAQFRLEEDSRWFTIVGVVKDIRQESLDSSEPAAVYFPSAQKSEAWLNWMSIVVNTSGKPEELGGTVREAVWSVDREQPITEVSSLETYLGDSVAIPRLRMIAVGSFSLIAFCIVLIGVYATVSYSVAQRVHEIGIRMALGAAPRDVLLQFVSHGLRFTSAGLVIGFLIAVAMARAIASQLFAVRPLDAATYFFVANILGITALLACYLPARRATRVDPMVALRYE